MGKGGTVRANLHATRAKINNASTSAQTRAFKARQVAKQKRDTAERKFRATQAAANEANAATTTPTTTERDVSAEIANEQAKPSAPTE